MNAKHADRIGYYTFIQAMIRRGMPRDLAASVWLAGAGFTR